MLAFRHRPLAGGEPRALTVDVVRYTPQAVVVANVEEARYRALASEDGRLLVEARYAIRNNQRSFLKVALPNHSVLWSAEVANRPVQPGRAGDGSILLPLEKGRAGEQAPTFVVALVYYQRVDHWVDKSKPRVMLPVLDLPISRTGFELRHSPRFRIEAQAGVFRVEQDSGPTAEALRRPQLEMAVAVAPATADRLQTLVDRFRNESGGHRRAGTLPVHVDFPELGPSLFFASELTAESSAPALDFIVRRIGH